jgi:hypothetical protein
MPQIPIRTISSNPLGNGIYEVRGCLVTQENVTIVVHAFDDPHSNESFVIKRRALWYIELHGGVSRAYTTIPPWFEHGTAQQHIAEDDDKGSILLYANCDSSSLNPVIRFDVGDQQSILRSGACRVTNENDQYPWGLLNGKRLELIAERLELITGSLFPAILNEVRRTNLAIDMLRSPENGTQNPGLPPGSELKNDLGHKSRSA